VVVLKGAALLKLLLGLALMRGLSDEFIGVFFFKTKLFYYNPQEHSKKNVTTWGPLVTKKNKSNIRERKRGRQQRATESNTRANDTHLESSPHYVLVHIPC
jgi:hypothetical protein